MADRTQHLLDWASKNVREPWEKMVEVADKVYQGEPLTDEEALIRIPLTPFKADYRELYPAVKAFAGLVTWSPNNLFTIILDPDEKRILRAYMEVTRDHNYVQVIPVDPGLPFMVEALDIIKTGELYPLRKQLDEACREHFKIRINWVKIANLEFFGAFESNMAAFEESVDFWDWAAGALAAVQNIYDNNWIRFTPEPPVFARMRELFTDILEVNPEHLDFKAMFGPLLLNRPAGSHTVLILSDHDERICLSMGGANPDTITFTPKITDSFQSEGAPFHLLAKVVRKAVKADLAVALRIEPVANLVYEALYNKMPYNRDDYKGILRKAMEILRRFREQWTMDPLPFYLHDWLRLPAKWLGNPYDINYLATWFLPGMILDGEAVFLGQHNIRTFVNLDGKKIISCYTAEFYDSGIRKIITHDPAKYQDVFSDLNDTYDDAREGAIQLGIRLWNDGFGFQNQVMVTQTEFLKTVGETGSLKIWRNPLRLWRLFTPIRRIVKLAKAGAVVSYPDKLFFELEKWIQKVGRIHVYLPVSTVPFDRKQPRKRGLLFIKPTIAAGLLLGLAAWLFFF